MQNTSETPDEIAKTILREYVFSDAFRQADLQFDEDLEKPFDSKMWLYRLALSLMVLLAEEQGKPELARVREQFETHVFPVSQEEGMELLAQVRLAMQRLNELLHEDTKRELSWAASWFKEIGIDETDPINLTLFASGWMRQYKMVTDVLRSAEISAE